MKRFLAAALVAALGSVGLVGCGSGSSGGPGATSKDKPMGGMGQAEDSFSLDVPNLATHVKQTEAKVVSIGIKRGKNFGQDVGLMFEGLPKGVTVDPATPDVKAGMEKVDVTVKAAADAALGDFTVKVKGHPKTGADASNEFKLTVEKK